MNDQKLQVAADACLSVAINNPMPFIAVRDFIATLKDNPNWTDAEIIEVQTRIIRLLMQRMGLEH